MSSPYEMPPALAATLSDIVRRLDEIERATKPRAALTPEDVDRMLAPYANFRYAMGDIPKPEPTPATVHDVFRYTVELLREWAETAQYHGLVTTLNHNRAEISITATTVNGVTVNAEAHETTPIRMAVFRAIKFVRMVGIMINDDQSATLRPSELTRKIRARFVPVRPPEV